MLGKTLTKPVSQRTVCQATKGATTYKAAHTVAPVAPTPPEANPLTGVAVFGGATAVLSYVLVKSLVKGNPNGSALNTVPASSPLVSAMKFSTSAAQVSFRSSKVDVFASKPADVATVSATVLDRMDVGDIVQYSLKLEDGSQVSAALLPAEDRAVWGFFDEIGSIFGGQKPVFVRVKPLDFEPVAAPSS